MKTTTQPIKKEKCTCPYCDGTTCTPKCPKCPSPPAQKKCTCGKTGWDFLHTKEAHSPQKDLDVARPDLDVNLDVAQKDTWEGNPYEVFIQKSVNFDEKGLAHIGLHGLFRLLQKFHKEALSEEREALKQELKRKIGAFPTVWDDAELVSKKDILALLSEK